MRRIYYLLLTFIVVLFCGCGSGNNNSTILDASGKHPSGWVVQANGGEHPGYYFSQPNSCVQCHGSDLLGGTSKVSCFAADYNGFTCHPSGLGHPPGWAAPEQHGAKAKAPVAGNSGMGFCKNCHGPDYNGSPSQTPSCLVCHGATSPHPQATQWRSAASPPQVPYTHTNTDTSNAQACSQCHNATVKNLAQPYQARFVPAGSFNNSAPGCYNGSMCHANIIATTNCNVCHGALASGVFNSLSGIITPSNTKVGAHTKHYAPSISSPIACQQCHPMPSSYTQSGLHRNSATNFAFGKLATYSGALSPAVVPSATGFTCTNVYCHGVTLGGGSNKTPRWNDTAYNSGCGTCHGYPPPPPHTTSTGCNSCHTEVNSSNNGFTPSGVTLHINGKIDVSSSSAPHAAPWFEHNAAAGSSCMKTGGGCHNTGNGTILYPLVKDSATGAPDCMSCHTLADPLIAGNGLGDCKSCHGTGGTGTLAAPTGTSWPNIRGSNSNARHPSHHSAVCGTCHPGVDDTGRTSTNEAGSGSGINHGPNKNKLSGTVQLNNTQTVTGITPNAARGTGSTCSHSSIPTNSCHSGPGTQTWTAP